MYLIGGQRYATNDPEFADTLAHAYASRERPRCLCIEAGVEMYIARFGAEHFIKRMPYSGCQHAADCPSYEPPVELSGAREVIGSAVSENTDTGMTTLKLAFALSRLEARATGQIGPTAASSAKAEEPGLGLRALLHYLWDRGELTHWRPTFAGKRSWAIVRLRILAVATKALVRGAFLAERLYVPETFAVERRDEIELRRVTHWRHAAAGSSKRQNLMLLLGELKELVPTRYGYKAVIKHLPDKPFLLPERLYRQVERKFERELSLWAASELTHLVTLATFKPSVLSLPVIEEMSMMLVSQQWMPIEDGSDQQLIGKLVHDGRRFVKTLAYNQAASEKRCAAVLTDCAVTADCTVDSQRWRR